MDTATSVFATRARPTKCAKPWRALRDGSRKVRGRMANAPLATVLWPNRSDGFTGALRVIVLVVAGTASLTLSAKIKLPLPYVPMTLQTLVVLLIGAAYGWRLGVITVIAYLGTGAAGLPVFAAPSGGLAPLVGPTAGYLFGFVSAAFCCGWLSEVSCA